MEFKNWILTEMPINKFELIGNWGKGRGSDPQLRFPFGQEDAKKKYGYKKDDIGILTSPIAVQKIKNQWLKTKHKFEFYFLRSKEGKNFVEVGEVGHDFLLKKLNLTEEDIPSHFDAITVIFTNNFGSERVPMTGWMISHRLAHAFSKDKKFSVIVEMFLNHFRTLIQQTYGITVNNSNQTQLIKSLAHEIGTFGSARKGLIRNEYEFIFELFSQHLLSNISFNQLPKSLITGYSYGRPNRKFAKSENLAEGNANLDILKDELNQKFDYYLDGRYGRMYVM